MRWRTGTWILLGTLLIGACGGDDTPTTATDTSEPATQDATAEVQPTAMESAASSEATDGSASGVAGGREDYEPGDVSFRFAHFAPDAGPVDVYVATSQGLVEHYEWELGVEFGTVLDDIRPPTDGQFVVYPAGTSELIAVGPDANTIMDIGTAVSEDNGPERTVVLSDGDDEDGIEVTEYWESPDPSQVGTYANALPPAEAGRGTLILAHDAGERTAVKPAIAGGDGCLTPVDESQSNLYVGGTSVIAYPVDGPTDLTFHSFDDGDSDCTGEPVLTTSVDVPVGERAFVVLYDDGSGLAAQEFDLP